MPVDPQVQALLDMMTATGGEKLSHDTLAATRDGFGVLLAMTAGEGPDDVTVTERVVAGPHGDLPLRVYTPSGDGVRGAVLFIHGGGWTIGSAAAYDPIAKMVAAAADTVVVSVEYRLAPEHPFPVAYDECWFALQWLAEHGSELGTDGRLAVMGDSAGGNLSAALAQRAVAENGPTLLAQVLIYPATDTDFDRASHIENAVGYFLERDTMLFFWDCYVPDVAGRADPRVAPLRAPSFADVAPALVITAEFDPLRDEGEAYAEVLAVAGVEVEATRYDGMIHGFFMMPNAIADGARAIGQSAAFIRRAFGTLSA